MRQFLNLFEDQPQTVEPTLSGTLDLTGLMAMLPLVNDQPRFLSAYNKAKAGQGASMDNNEKTQFALAFISLLGETPQQRQQVINKLASLTVQSPPASNT